MADPSPRIPGGYKLDLQQGPLQEWHWWRPLTAQRQIAGYRFAQTVLTQTTLSKSGRQDP
jgi:hypothetical protein